MRIAFAGNPNSGKTTMYNALTGRHERVGNWAGVTVERKESLIKKAYYDGAEELVAVDLPGAYSMSPFTSEESITSSYVKNEHPDAIINIVDATNLSRSLFFTTQLLELGVPVVVALNKSDITDKKQTKIDEKLLSEKLYELAPEIQFLGEEEGLHAMSGDTFWILDPVDGTTNLIHDYQHSTVSLGLYEKGEIVMGVLYAPFRAEVF